MKSHHPRLTQHAHELLAASLAWMDPQWDAAASMLRLPSYSHDADSRILHHVRETCYYALALLMRGDTERAVRAIEAVVECQLDAPDTAFHGTWLRHPEEPTPGANAREWADYDPNWREFIGTGLMVILAHFETELPPGLVARVDSAIRRACIGSIQRNISAHYTNIALMSAFLLDFAGTRLGEQGWVASGETLAGEIRALFEEHGAFPEYNSPTYYGVDIYALALWRSYAPGTKLREWGNEMEHALWRDIARYYHAEMRNMAGPFDRAYGMDMRRYAAAAGMWFWLYTGHELAPFPDTTKPFDHAHDFSFAPLVAACGANIPEDAAGHFTTFAGARQVTRRIDASRVATAWLEERLMLGGEWTHGEARAWDQFHPATVHWKHGADIHWMRIETYGAIDVRVEKNRMSVFIPAGTHSQDVAFRWLIHAPGTRSGVFSPTKWSLPGLSITIECGNVWFSSPTKSGELIGIGCKAEPDKSGELTMQFDLCP